jgi:ADP-ribosylglycohydrolase
MWVARRAKPCRQPTRPDRTRRKQLARPPVKDGQANGALMRCAPIGMWARDAKEAAAAAREDALLSHPHPVCQAASAAFVAAIATAIGGGDREAMLAAAYAAVPEPEASVVRRRLDLAKRGEGPEDFMHQQGWLLTAFQNAFRHLASGTPIEDALIETVGEGGDTDTNAAICGRVEVTPLTRRAGRGHGKPERPGHRRSCPTHRRTMI